MLDPIGGAISDSNKRSICRTSLVKKILKKPKEAETRKIIDKVCAVGELKTVGDDINNILPPISRFGAAAKKRGEKKQRVIELS